MKTIGLEQLNLKQEEFRTMNAAEPTITRRLKGFVACRATQLLAMVTGLPRTFSHARDLTTGG